MENATLVELTATVNRLADLAEVILKEQRRTANKLGADIDEVPAIVRIELEKVTTQVRVLIEKLSDPRHQLTLWHDVLSATRYAAWMSKQSSEQESEAEQALRRMIDFIRDAVRAKLGQEPDSLGEPDVRVGLVKAKKEREDDDTGVHLVWGGKPVAKIKAKKIIRWTKRLAYIVVPALSAAGVHLLHTLGVLK